MRDKKHYAGHWLGLGLGVGLSAGIVADVLLSVLAKDKMPWFGICASVGVLAGLITGILLEKKNQHRRKSLTHTEKQKHNQVIILTAMSIAMLIIVSIFLYIKKMNA